MQCSTSPAPVCVHLLRCAAASKCVMSCICTSSACSLRPQTSSTVIGSRVALGRWHQPRSWSAASRVTVGHGRHHSEQSFSSLDSASFDSQDVAEELLGSSQRKGAASVSTESLASTHSHDSHSSGSSHHDNRQYGHGHSHAPDIEGRIHRVLLWLYQRTGLFQLANLLRENSYGSMAISVLIAVAALAHWQAGTSLLAARTGERISHAATAGVYLLAGIPAAVDLTFDLASLHIDTHVLMTLAAFGTLAIGGALEGALLLVLFQVSHTVEHTLTDRAQGNLKSLFDSMPESATIVDLNSKDEPDMDSQREVRAADLEVGSHMLVKPGEQVPLDGKIVYGEALVSMQHITGESLPVRQTPGASIPAGSQNHDGLLVIQATCASDDSTPARISRLAADAQASKPQLRRWIDTVGEVYSKCVIAATLAALVILPMLGVPLVSSATQRGALYRAMGLLTTASPCALVLVPLAYVSAIAAITSRGMLIKGGRVIDALASCQTVAFDKTGTLTTGALTCTGMTALDRSQNGDEAPNALIGNGWLQQLVQKGHQNDQAALAAAAELSVRANHPVSKAVTRCCARVHKSLPEVDIIDFKLVPGAGVQGTLQAANGAGKRYVRFGSAKFAAQVLSQPASDALIEQAANIGKDRVVSVLVQSMAAGSEKAYGDDPLIRIFTFQDTLNEQSLAAVTDLQEGRWAGKQNAKHRVRVTMLTGDNQTSAEFFSKELGISDVRAGLSPEDKLEAVRSLRSDAPAGSPGGGVIMVGDGINDTPALAAADVGVAVAEDAGDGAGNAADIVLLSGASVSALPFLLAVARRTRAILLQNMALALGSIAALALPVLAGWLPLWVAVTLHEGSTLLVALNSLRLLHWPANPIRGGGSTSDDDVKDIAVPSELLQPAAA